MPRVLKPGVSELVFRAKVQDWAEKQGKEIGFSTTLGGFTLLGEDVTREDEDAILQACDKVLYNPGQRHASILSPGIGRE